MEQYYVHLVTILVTLVVVQLQHVKAVIVQIIDIISMEITHVHVIQVFMIMEPLYVYRAIIRVQIALTELL